MSHCLDSLSSHTSTENIVLATVDGQGQPYARYHVHRGFVQMEKGEAQPYLLTTTDLKMPKSESGTSKSSPSWG